MCYYNRPHDIFFIFVSASMLLALLPHNVFLTFCPDLIATHMAYSPLRQIWWVDAFTVTIITAVVDYVPLPVVFNSLNTLYC